MRFADLYNKLPGSLIVKSLTAKTRKLWFLAATQFSELNNLQNSLQVLRDINAASGLYLDKIGELVNEPRLGRDDEEYRLFIKVAISSNRSPGTIPSVIEIARVISGEEVDFDLQEMHTLTGELFLDNSRFLDGTDALNPFEARPASFNIVFNGAVSLLRIPKNLSRFIDKIRAAGITGKLKAIFELTVTQSISAIYNCSVDLLLAVLLVPVYSRKTFVTLSTYLLPDTEFTAVLDGTAFLDGSTNLSGTSGVSPTYILSFSEAEA